MSLPFSSRQEDEDRRLPSHHVTMKLVPNYDGHQGGLRPVVTRPHWALAASLFLVLVICYFNVLVRLHALEQRPSCACEYPREKSAGPAQSTPGESGHLTPGRWVETEQGAQRKHFESHEPIQTHVASWIRGKKPSVEKSRHFRFPNIPEAMGLEPSDRSPKTIHTVSRHARSASARKRDFVTSPLRSANRKSCSVAAAIKCFIRKEIHRGYSLPIKKYVDNAHEVLNPKAGQHEVLEDIPCRPEARSNGWLHYTTMESKDKGCPLMFLKSVETVTRRELLHFDNQTGIFTVKRAGFYLLHISIDYIVETGAVWSRPDLGVFANGQSVMTCLHGQSSVLESSHLSTRTRFRCNLNGMVQLEKGDSLSLRPMVSNFSLVFTEQPSLHFHIILLQKTKHRTRAKHG